MQNIGLWVFPILAGVILDHTNASDATKLDYTFTQFMFAALGLAGLVFALLLKHNDKVSGYGLELPSNKKV